MKESCTLLQISDTHFGTEEPAVVAAVLRLCADQRPDLAILSGDITQRARAHQFAAAARFFSRLDARRRLALPGNHDIPLFNLFARVFHPYAGYQAAFGEELEPVLDWPAARVIGVNTTRPERHEDGEVSPRQIATVTRHLSAASPEQLRIVVTHQPIHVITDQDRKNRLHGAEPALSAWADAGADLVLGGHIHLPYVRRLGREAGLARTVWIVQAGTAVSRRVRGGIPNSLNLIRYIVESGARRCSVERWDYSRDADRFTNVVTTPLDLDSPQCGRG